MAKDKAAFDASPSQRRKDENGFMHVDSCHITKEQVVKYYGREIPGWQELGLESDRLYNVYRPAEEIERAAPTFDGLPLLLQHHLESADEPQKEFRVGSISRPVWNAPYLDCDLHITDGTAIDAIEHGDFKEISAAYLYDPVKERGTFDGDDYEIVMRNLRGNHVALVEKGRAGADVVVADSAPRIMRSFAAWMRGNPLALKDSITQAWHDVKAAMDDAWITVHPNEGVGRPVLLDDNGVIKGGMGGKFTGQRIDLIPRTPKAPPSGTEVVSPVSARYNTSQTSGTSQGGRGGMGRSEFIKNYMDEHGIEETDIRDDPFFYSENIKNEINDLKFLERAAQTPERKEALKQQREQLQPFLDEISGRSPETTREYFQKLVDMRNYGSDFRDAAMGSYDVRQKNYPIPENQDRIGFPPKVVGETDRAYKVRESNPNVELVHMFRTDFLPKTRVTMKDGYVIGMEGWLKDKTPIAVD